MQMKELVILQVKTFNEGYFVAQDVKSEEKFICMFRDKDAQWDRVYDFLNRNMVVEYMPIKDQVLVVLDILN